MKRYQAQIGVTLAAMRPTVAGGDQRPLGLEPERGVEPLTYALRVRCSTTELLRHGGQCYPGRHVSVLIPKRYGAVASLR